MFRRYESRNVAAYKQSRDAVAIKRKISMIQLGELERLARRCPTAIADIGVVVVVVAVSK